MTIFGSSFVEGSFQFELTFTAQAEQQYTAEERQSFFDGADFWSNIITGYQDGVSRTLALQIDSFSAPFSGGALTLGFAGPTNLTFTNPVTGAATSDGRFLVATAGIANFNTHPDAGPLNPLTVRHEIGHILGIGTLWEDNEVYNDGVAGNSTRTLTSGVLGQYVGASGLEAYQREFDPSATFIPVELDGEEETANNHWNEVLDNFVLENMAGFDGDPGDESEALTVLFGPHAGESLDDELLTGVLSGSAFLSNTTIMSLQDIGFTVAIPEPSSLMLLGVGAAFGLRRRR